MMDIIAIHKENKTITKYKLDDGRIVTKEECILLVKNKQILNYNIGISRINQEFIKRKHDENGKRLTPLYKLPKF